MKNYTYAWRNLWRNRRRTFITAASIFFAVFFALIMRSLQLGTYDYMFKNIIESYSGYIQVQNPEFWEDKVVDNTMLPDEDLISTLKADKNVLELIPRFESFALASSGSRTKGVMIMGINPEKENLLSDVKNKLVKYRLTEAAIDSLTREDIPRNTLRNLKLFSGSSYSGDGKLQTELGIRDKDTSHIMPLFRKHAGVQNGYFSQDSQGALVGNRLAQYLGLSRGDTIVLLGQGYHGTTAAGKYAIDGIVRLPAPDLDNKIVYLPVTRCQELYNAPGRLTALVLHIKDNSDRAIEQTVERLMSRIDSTYRLMGWKEMNDTIVNQMDADNKSGMIMIGILYLVIAFGVFGTVLMMTAERRREMGVLISIGMRKSKMAIIMLYEMLLIGIMGIMSGVAVSLPVIIYGYHHPIVFSSKMAKMWEDYGFEPVMAFQWIDTYFIWQSLVVAIIVLIAAMYPVFRIYRLKEVEALKA
ncbi:MAG TPA: ABC transporter permease [Bacteroidetes bacterium]|nr:ABC transporter permease [Bacteroidota bacterium]